MMSCHHPLTHAIAGAGAFFSLGLAGGLHCVGMCGPLACLLGRPEERPVAALGLYHGGRMAAYAAVGFTFAWLGRPLQPILTWPVLAAVASVPLLLYAFWPRTWSPALLQRLYAGASRWVAALPPLRRALSLGLLTPALPCGLLYAAAGAALSAPSPLMGAGWMLAFAAGTLPLLLLGQAGFVWAARGRELGFVQGLRRASAVLAALTILFLSFLG